MCGTLDFMNNLANTLWKVENRYEYCEIQIELFFIHHVVVYDGDLRNCTSGLDQRLDRYRT